MTNGNADDKENLIPCGAYQGLRLRTAMKIMKRDSFKKLSCQSIFFICKRNIERKEWQSITLLPGIVGSTSNEMLFDVAVFMSRE